MNHKTLLFFLLLSFAVNGLFAQSDHLKRMDAFLIGPDNVDVFHNIQSEYYIENYQLLRENILIEKEDNLEEIQSLDKKRFNRKKTLEEITFLEATNTLIDTEVEKIDRFLKLWSTWETPIENTSFLKGYQAKNCYQIDGSEFTYFPTDYRLDTLKQGSQISWHEKVDQMLLEYEFELVEVEAAREKWVKKKADRNCLSADPNDCLVWCMVETPAKFDTIVIQEATLGCMEGFLLDQSGDQCERIVISDEEVDTELSIKLIDVLTSREIRVKEFEIISCD